MDCREAAPLLLDHRRQRLDPDLARALDDHLAGCARCRHEAAADAALSDALGRLRPRTAPGSLTRSLSDRWLPPPRPAVSAARRRLPWALAAAGAIGALGVLGLTIRQRGASEPMVTEAINDHLRLLYSEHPLEVANGGIHQVKPWFAGRVDFAPVVGFGGDDEFPMQGGSVAYFLDRKAAAYEYKRRLHPITLLVFPAEGLSWPLATYPVGRATGTLETRRGFHVILWKQNDLGYALISDLDERELTTLGARIAERP